MQERRSGIAKAPQRKDIGNDFALRGICVCADCGVPLRSSWSTGRGKSYPYYLCQTKTCDAYGKSIPRDKLEGEIGELVRALQPTQKLFAMARGMFTLAWEQRRQQAAHITRSGRQQMAGIEKQIEALLTRIIDASNATVIRSYEAKVTEFERQKTILAEQLAAQAEPKGKFEDQLEPALTFLANPWKLWQTGHVGLRRTVLKLAFADRIAYSQNEGPRTPKIALPFKMLEGFTDPGVCFGAQERHVFC